MTNYRKCERVARVADGRSLKIVGFGDIAVMFLPSKSIIPSKLCNVAHVREITYNLFSLTGLLKRGPGFTGGQIGNVVSLQQSKMPMIFENCGNLYEIYGSRPNGAGIAFIVMNDADDEARPRERSDRGRFLPSGKKASSYRGASRVPLFNFSMSFCLCVRLCNVRRLN